MPPSHFGFREPVVEKVLADPAQEPACFPALAERVLSRKRNLRVIISCQAVVETVPQVLRPFFLDLAGTDQVQSKHPAHPRVAFGGDLVNL